MQKIAVPIDFSPASLNSSEYAASLARVFAGKIYLLHVFSEPVPVSGVPVMWMSAGELHKDLDARVQREAARLAAKYSISVEGCARCGYKADTINAFAKEVRADLIVMAMKENRSTLLGSTTFREIRKSRIPVLVVPLGASFVPVKRVVWASDLQEIPDDLCFETVYRIVEKFGAALQVVHVRKRGVGTDASRVSGRLQLERYLSKASFSYREVEHKSVEQGILNFSQGGCPADLLVMVAHPHPVLEHLFGTVHTRSVSRKIKIPLLVLEDKGARVSSGEAYEWITIHS